MDRISEKIDINNQNNFKNTGGIFNPLSSDIIESMINDENFEILVALNSLNKVIGCLIIKYKLSELFKSENTNLTNYIPNNFCMFYDILVSQEYRKKGISKHLANHAFQKLMSKNITYIFLEIYRIQYDINNSPLLPNNNSIFQSKKLGSIYLCEYNNFVLQFDTIRVRIMSSLYMFDLTCRFLRYSK